MDNIHDKEIQEIKKIYKDGKVSKKMYEILLEIRSNIKHKNKCRNVI